MHGSFSRLMNEDTSFIMSNMKKRVIVWIAAMAVFAPILSAGEKEMKAALDVWQQRQAEYNAVLSVTTTPEQRDSVPPPSADEVAPALWKAVRKQTGTRKVASATRRGYEKAELIDVPKYEFDEEWAAPAVVWFLNHPETLAKMYERAPQKLATYAKALLDSVRDRHFSSPLIGEACAKLSENTGADVYSVLQKIYERNSSPAARGAAALAMSVMLTNPALVGEEGGAAHARAKRIYLIRQALNLAPQDAMFGTASLTDVATELIYRITNLDEGTIPPRMTLTDPQGKECLFPVVGKANLIFFWDPSEDVGMSIMQKQAVLLRSYPNLVLCPIVVNGDRESWLRMMQSHGLSICYMDDERGTAGKAYRVEHLPHAVLVNEQARVLFYGYPDMQLQTALDCWKNQSKERPSPPREPATPESQPEPQTTGDESPNHSAPPLREMPQF